MPKSTGRRGSQRSPNPIELDPNDPERAWELLSSEARRSLSVWSEKTGLDEEVVSALMIVSFSRWLSRIDDPDSFVLLVRGKVDAYDNSLDALIGASGYQDQVRRFVQEWQESVS